MKLAGAWISCSLLALGSWVACGSDDDSNSDAQGGLAGSSGSGGSGSTGSGGEATESSTTKGSGAAGEGGAASDCVDEYPYDDGYTCEQQAGWGKCDEIWLQCYCHASCNRCGSIPDECGGAGVDHGGPRDVFTSYTDKEPLAPTPPMGWNSWNKFGCDIDEQLVREIADAMVDSGMRDAGYEYVNIDDCWQAPERDEEGNILADPERFPSGMQALADYVHGLGLKLGLYSDRGTHTCAGYPGSYGYEVQDAETYAEWGIDYLKYDNCNIPNGREADPEMREDYAIMGEALRQAGHPVVYSICAWWFRDWMPEVGHLWRTTTDIKDNWSDDKHGVVSLLNWSGGDTARYGAFSEDDFDSGAYPPPGLAQYAGPNAWNDPDMLEVGNGGMTDTEYRSHFSLWALMAAPLVAGNDLRDMSEATLAILTNPEVIAVNQDPLGIQGTPISESVELEVWSKPLQGDDTYAVILFNRTEAEADITVTWEQLGLASSTALVRDLWLREDVGELEDEYTTPVPSHGVVMLKVTGQ